MYGPESGAVDVSVVVHTFDLAHDLKIQPPKSCWSRIRSRPSGDAIAALVRDRLNVAADGAALQGAAWSAPEALPDRQSIRVRARFALAAPGRAHRRADADVSVRPAAQDVPERLRERRGRRSGDSRQGPHGVRVLRRHEAGRPGGAAEVRPGGRAPHPDRPGPPAVPGGPAAARRHAETVAAGRHRVYHSAQHHAVAGGARDGDAAARTPSSRLSRSASCMWARTICSSAPAGATRAPGSRSRSA